MFIRSVEQGDLESHLAIAQAKIDIFKIKIIVGWGKQAETPR